MEPKSSWAKKINVSIFHIVCALLSAISDDSLDLKRKVDSLCYAKLQIDDLYVLVLL